MSLLCTPHNVEVSLYFLLLHADFIDLFRRSPELSSMRVARDFAPLFSSNVWGPVTNGRFGAKGLPYMKSTSFLMLNLSFLLYALYQKNFVLLDVLSLFQDVI